MQFHYDFRVIYNCEILEKLDISPSYLLRVRNHTKHTERKACKRYIKEQQVGFPLEALKPLLSPLHPRTVESALRLFEETKEDVKISLTCMHWTRTSSIEKMQNQKFRSIIDMAKYCVKTKRATTRDDNAVWMWMKNAKKFFKQNNIQQCRTMLWHIFV